MYIYSYYVLRENISNSKSLRRVDVAVAHTYLHYLPLCGVNVSLPNGMMWVDSRGFLLMVYGLSGGYVCWNSFESALSSGYF